MKKKTGIIIVSVLVIIIIAIVGLYQYGKTLIPYYNNTSKNIVLVSNKENKLTDEQIDEFYNIARGALTSHDKDLNFTNLDDYSLYVEKLKGEKGKYLINYICENPTTKLRFENKIEVVLQSDKLGSDEDFSYEILKSDLLEFTGAFGK